MRKRLRDDKRGDRIIARMRRPYPRLMIEWEWARTLRIAAEGYHWRRAKGRWRMWDRAWRMMRHSAGRRDR